MSNRLCRIANTSNYDSETYSESLVNLPPMPQEMAWNICDLVNSIAPNGPAYYKPVPTNYQPYIYDPNA